MARRVNLTYPTALILQALVNGYEYGFDIMDATGLPSGTVYSALRRLEAAGYVSSDWEDAKQAQQEQRPPRRNYVIRARGEEALVESRKRIRLLASVLPQVPRKQRPSEG